MTNQENQTDPIRKDKNRRESLRMALRALPNGTSEEQTKKAEDYYKYLSGN